MTVQELEITLENDMLEEQTRNKLELVLKSSTVLSRTMQKELINDSNLREETSKLLQSKKFKDATLDTILKILEHKEDGDHLRRNELKIIRDKKLSDPRYLEVCKKLNNGLMYCIASEDNDVLYFELQEIMSEFMDVVEKRSANKIITL